MPCVTPVVRPLLTTLSPSSASPSCSTWISSSSISGLNVRSSMVAMAQSPPHPGGNARARHPDDSARRGYRRVGPLHNVVSDASEWPVQDMPVAQDVRRPDVLVVDDAANSPGRHPPVCHAGAGDNRVDACLTWVGDTFGDDFIRRFVAALEHISRNFDAVDNERFRY